MKPRPSFGRGYDSAIDMICGRGPTGGSNDLPLGAFTVRDIGPFVARYCGRRNTVALDAESCAVRLGPRLHGHHEPFIEKFRYRPAPIVSNVRCLRTDVND